MQWYDRDVAPYEWHDSEELPREKEEDSSSACSSLKSSEPLSLVVSLDRRKGTNWQWEGRKRGKSRAK